MGTIFRISTQSSQYGTMYWGTPTGTGIPLVSKDEAEFFDIQYQSAREYSIRPISSESVVGVDRNCVLGAGRTSLSQTWMLLSRGGKYIIAAKYACKSKRFLAPSPTYESVVFTSLYGAWTIERVTESNTFAPDPSTSEPSPQPTVAPTSIDYTPQPTIAPTIIDYTPQPTIAPTSIDYTTPPPTSIIDFTPSPSPTAIVDFTSSLPPPATTPPATTGAYVGPRPAGWKDGYGTWMSCLSTLTHPEDGYDNRGTPPFDPASCSPYRVATRDGCFQVVDGAWVPIDRKNRTDRRRCYTATSLRQSALRNFEFDTPTPTPTIAYTTLPPTTAPPDITTLPPDTTMPWTSPPGTTEYTTPPPDGTTTAPPETSWYGTTAPPETSWYGTTAPPDTSITVPPETSWYGTTAPPETSWYDSTTAPPTTAPPETTWYDSTTAPPETTWYGSTTAPPTTMPLETTWYGSTTSPPTTAPPGYDSTTSPPTTAPPETTWYGSSTAPPETTWYGTTPPPETSWYGTTPPPETSTTASPSPTTSPPSWLTTAPPETSWFTSPPPGPLYIRPWDTMPSRISIISYKYPGRYIDLDSAPTSTTAGSIRLSTLLTYWYTSSKSTRHTLRFNDANGYVLSVGGTALCNDGVLVNNGPGTDYSADHAFQVLDVDGVTGGVLLRFVGKACADARFLIGTENGRVAATTVPPTAQTMENYLWKVENQEPPAPYITTAPPYTGTPAPTETLLPLTTLPPTTLPPDTTSPPPATEVLQPSLMVKVSVPGFQGLLRSEVIAKLFQLYPSATVQELSDGDQQCAATLLGKPTRYVQSYLAAYHPERKIQVIRDATLGLRAPVKGSDLIQLIESSTGTVDAIKCGRSVPDAKPLQGLIRVYYNAASDTVIDVYTYDYFDNTPTASSTPSPTPTTSATGGATPRPDIDLSINVDGGRRGFFGGGGGGVPSFLLGGGGGSPAFGPVVDGGLLDPLAAAIVSPPTSTPAAVATPDAKKATSAPVAPQLPPQWQGAAGDDTQTTTTSPSGWSFKKRLFVILVVAAVLGAGWYVYNKFFKKTTGNNGGNTNTNTGTGAENFGGDFSDFDFGAPQAGGTAPTPGVM